MRRQKHEQPKKPDRSKPSLLSTKTESAGVITDQKVKEIVMETLIELDLIPKAQKKKAITNV